MFVGESHSKSFIAGFFDSSFYVMGPIVKIVWDLWINHFKWDLSKSYESLKITIIAFALFDTPPMGNSRHIPIIPKPELSGFGGFP